MVVFDRRTEPGIVGRVLLLLIILFQWAPRVIAHEQGGGDALGGPVARLAEPILAHGRSVGISIGILDADGQGHTYGFGRVGKQDDRAPDQDTLFELGSITKCFTGILLAQMTLNHEVRLQDPAVKYLEGGVRIPRVGGRPITLEELATYSSGLPRMPTNRGRTQKEHSRYSAPQMLEYLGALAARERGQGPNRHYLYSNLGFALLGHCLAERARMPVRPLILGRVVKPLGMESTCFEPSARLLGRVAKTYDKNGKPVPPWETGVIAPAGMLRSSARDMLAFIAANVDRFETPLRDALHLAQKPRYRTGTSEKHPREHEIGLAWFIDQTTGFIDHDGSTAGSSSYVVFDPATRTGVVLLMNQNGGPAIALARQIMRLVNRRYRPEPHPPVPRSHDDEGGEETPAGGE